MLRRDGEIEHPDFLIDTGYQGQVGIKQGLIDEYGLSQGLLSDGTPTSCRSMDRAGTVSGFGLGWSSNGLVNSAKSKQYSFHIMYCLGR